MFFIVNNNYKTGRQKWIRANGDEWIFTDLKRETDKDGKVSIHMTFDDAPFGKWTIITQSPGLMALIYFDTNENKETNRMLFTIEKKPEKK